MCINIYTRYNLFLFNFYIPLFALLQITDWQYYMINCWLPLKGIIRSKADTIFLAVFSVYYNSEPGYKESNVREPWNIRDSLYRTYQLWECGIIHKPLFKYSKDISKPVYVVIL